MYLDSRIIRYMVKYRKAINHLKRPEFLEPCSYCGSVAGLRVGIDDYLNDILSSIENKKQKNLYLSYAVIQFQKIWRGYSERKQLKSLQQDHDNYKKMITEMALRIQCMYRRVLAKRRLKTFYYLRCIKTTHPSVLLDATTARNTYHVFWYDNPEDTSLLYKDYKLLVEKTSYFPPLRVVEINIETIYTRIYNLVSKYATIIQKIFRGYLGRRCSKQMKLAYSRIMQYKLDAILTLQCFIRKCLAKKYRVQLESEKVTNGYSQYIKKNKTMNSKEWHDKILIMYQMEYKNEQSCRMTGVIGYTNNKSKNYMESAYGSDTACKEMTKFAKLKQDELKQQKKERKEHRKKIDFMRKQISQNGAYKHYYAIEKENEIEKQYLNEYINSLH